MNDRRSSRVRVITCVLLFAISLIRYQAPYDPTAVVPHDPESLRLAWSIADHGDFANPFVPLDTGPSAHLAPIFPAWLALLIWLFGGGAIGFYAIKFSAVVILSAQIALFPVISEILGMGFMNGCLAALLWIAARIGMAYGPKAAPDVMFGWESFYGAPLVMLGFCLWRRYLATPRRTWSIGMSFGVLTLIVPTAVIIVLAWMIWEIRSVRWRPSLLVIPVLVVLPWLIRDYAVFGRLVFIRDNLGLELAASNNDCADFGIDQNLASGCFARVHPNASLDEATRVSELGEVRYNDLKMKQALSWIEGRPGRFLGLTSERLLAFWFPPATGRNYSLFGPGRRLERIAVDLMTLLSVVGFVLLYRKDRRTGWMCALCFSLFPLVYYLIQYEYRYRYPILWLSFCLGSIPITSLVRQIVLRIRRPSPKKQLILAAPGITA